MMRVYRIASKTQLTLIVILSEAKNLFQVRENMDSISEFAKNQPAFLFLSVYITTFAKKRGRNTTCPL